MIEGYLVDLQSELHVGRRRAHRVVDEVRDHLDESSDRLRDDGLDVEAAEVEAIARFGSATELARQFNAQAGTIAMRTRPLAGLGAAVAIGVSFLLGVRAAGGGHRPGGVNWLVVTSFQVGVLSTQVAFVAGVRMVALVLGRWRDPLCSVADRALATRASRVLAVALVSAVVGLGVALALGSTDRSSARVQLWLALGGLGLGATVAVAGLLRECVHPGDIDPPGLDRGCDTAGPLAWGEWLIGVIVDHPVLSVVAVALITGLGAMSHAETTVWGSVPWGVGQAAAVVLGFVALRRPLGLTPDGAAAGPLS